MDYNNLLLIVLSGLENFEINNINNKLIFLDYVYVLLFFKGKMLLFYNVIFKFVKFFFLKVVKVESGVK